MRLYLSGPMAGYPGHNRDLFNQAAEQLCDAGFEVANPGEVFHGPDAGWEDCLRADLRTLLDCDAVATPPGMGDIARRLPGDPRREGAAASMPAVQGLAGAARGEGRAVPAVPSASRPGGRRSVRRLPCDTRQRADRRPVVTTPADTQKCELCGREGTRGFKTTEDSTANIPGIGEVGVPASTICKGRVACRRRQWRATPPKARQQWRDALEGA